MNAVFRNLAVRLWATAISGILVSLVLLPWWQQMVGVRWLPFAVSVILAVLFLAAGWAMDWLGRHLLGKVLQEASVWERAGMTAEASSALERGIALFDSFWFSLRQRRKQSRLLTSRLARFYLSRPTLGFRGRVLVRDYLFRHPEDQEIALAWLTWLQTLETPMPSEYETADRIRETLPHTIKIQQHLLRFYLAHGRTDYHALQTYENVWLDQSLQEPEQLRAVARLLLGETRLNHWIAALYLRAYETGFSDCLPGLVAAARWLPSAPENREILHRASRIADQLGADQCETLARRFRPPERQPVPEKNRMIRLSGLSALGKRWGQGLLTVLRMLIRSSGRLPGTIRNVGKFWPGSVGLRRAAIFTSVFAALTVLAIAGFRVIERRPQQEVSKPPPPPSPVQELPAITTDPFTIQVAAYQKAEDAKQFVAKLKENGLDAFWNEATSAHRKWFQVKVSHFATKAAAQAYAEQLKAKGLIDDFYVANYSPPPAESNVP